MVIVLHAIVITLIWVSPFLFRWHVILFGIALYYVEIITIGDCILTRRQFQTKKRDMTFYYYLLEKIGLRPSMTRVRIIADYVMPPLILGIALIWQKCMAQVPLIW